MNPPAASAPTRPKTHRSPTGVSQKKRWTQAWVQYAAAVAEQNVAAGRRALEGAQRAANAPGAPRGQRAAVHFARGKLEFDMGAGPASAAAKHFQAAYTNDPDGVLAEAALVRAAEAWLQAGETNKAKRARRDLPETLFRRQKRGAGRSGVGRSRISSRPVLNPGPFKYSRGCQRPGGGPPWPPPSFCAWRAPVPQQPSATTFKAPIGPP